MTKSKKSKKVNLEQTTKKVEDLTNKVGTIAKNRLIIAIFLIVDGITFLLNPDNTISEMAKNIIMVVIFAAFSIFIANLASKTKNTKTIVSTLAIMTVGIFFYFYPDLIAAYIQLFLALFIIYDGLSNIANALNLSKLSNFTQKVKEKYNKQLAKEAASRKEEFKSLDHDLDASLAEQKEKLLNPLKNIVGKTSKYSILFIIVNILSIILGIVLLIFPGVSMMIWGLIFLYTGLSNLLVTAKTMNLTGKIKERKFKEILFGEDEEKKPEN